MTWLSRWLLSTIAVSLLHLGCGWGGGQENDKIEILHEEKSPCGQFAATVFSCSGGGAAGYFYFNANLRKVGEKINHRDVLMGKHPTWKAFRDIDVDWVDALNLNVSYKQSGSPPYQENNAVKIKSKYGIRVNHLIKPNKTKDSKID
jgi:hypothetical protein